VRVGSSQRVVVEQGHPPTSMMRGRSSRLFCTPSDRSISARALTWRTTTHDQKHIGTHKSHLVSTHM
jgi:hypothetical protein